MLWKKKNSTKDDHFGKKRRRTPLVCQHQHQHTIKHKTRRTNTHERLIEYNNSERVSLHSPPCWFAILAWRWCEFYSAFPPSELSSFTGCERYAPMSLRRLRRRLQSVFNCFPKMTEIGVSCTPINTLSEPQASHPRHLTDAKAKKKTIQSVSTRRRDRCNETQRRKENARDAEYRA